MLLILQSAELDACTEHSDCRACLDMAKECLATRKGAASGVVVSRYTHESKEVVEVVATYFRDYGPRVEDGTIHRGFDVLCRGYVGTTVRLFSESERIMSDVWDSVLYAWVSTGDAATPFKKVCLGASFDREHGLRAEVERFVVDAPHLAVELDAYLERLRQDEIAKQAAAAAAAHRAAEAREMRRPERGKTVRVFKGRKVPVGIVGRCIWAGETRWGWRVGIKVEGREEPYWTAATNVEVLLPVVPAKEEEGVAA